MIIDKIHLKLTLIRFIEHGTFIVLSFILFDDHGDYNNNVFDFKIYICATFVIVFGLYYFIVVFAGAVGQLLVSSNRTLEQLLRLGMYDEIVEMYVFGFKYSDKDWGGVVDHPFVRNDQIAAALNAFLSRDEVDHESDNILSAIESHTYQRASKRDHERTLLSWAVDDKYGSVQCVAKLLKRKATNPNSKDQRGYTPLHYAITDSKGTSKLRLLLKAGADVNAKADNSYTPLHWAVTHNCTHDCIDALLDVSNVNVNETDKYGKTALDIAYTKRGICQGHKEEEAIINNTISKLISKGGKRGSEMKHDI